MTEFVPALLVALVGLAFATLQASKYPRPEARLLRASFAAHVVSALGQVWMMRGFYGYGDLLNYATHGEILAAALRADFSQFAPEVLKILFHTPGVVPTEIPGMGSSTASMAALAGILSFVTGGAAYTLCIAVGIMAYFGQVALYRAFRSAFGAEHRRSLLIAALLIPSEVFWSSALLKEAVAMAAFGYLILGLERTFLREVRPGGILMITLGAVAVSLFKAYILLATVAALGAGIYYRTKGRRSKVSRPAQFIWAVTVAATCYFGLTRAMPEYSIENFAERAATMQELGQEYAGGSTYSMGDPTSRTLVGQLAFAPIALGSSVFRPLLVEARNPLIFVNALETSAVLYLFVRVLRRRGVRKTWAVLTGNAVLMFCFAFVIVFGTGVGLTTTNMGTLSRYRVPLVPFLWVLLLVLDAKEPRTATQPVVTRVARRPARVGLPRRA